MQRAGAVVIRATLYALTFVLGFTLAAAALLMALTLWALGVRFDTNQMHHYE